MRRAGNLYDGICDPENLRLAYLKARRGKQDRGEVREFERDLEGNLALLALLAIDALRLNSRRKP